MAKRINFSELDDICKQFYKSHADFLNICNVFSVKLNSLLEEKSNARYYDIIEKLYEAYNTWVSGKFKNDMLEMWERSAGGFSSIASTYGTGDNAQSYAATCEREFKNCIKELSTFKIISRGKTDSPEMSASVYDDIIAKCSELINELEDNNNYHTKNISKIGEDNNIANSLVGICDGMHIATISYWKNQIEKLEIEKNAYLQFVNSQEARNEQSSQEMKKHGEQVANGVADVSKVVANNNDKTSDATSNATAMDASQSGNSSTEGNDNDTKKQEDDLPDEIKRRLMELKAQFDSSPNDWSVFRGLVLYSQEIGNYILDSFGEPVYFEVLLGLEKIIESYFTFVGENFIMPSDMESEVEGYNLYFVQYCSEFVDRIDLESLKNNPQQIDNLIVGARAIQNMCRDVITDYELVDDTAGRYADLVGNKLVMDVNNITGYSCFSGAASQMITSILNRVDFEPFNFSKKKTYDCDELPNEIKETVIEYLNRLILSCGGINAINNAMEDSDVMELVTNELSDTPENMEITKISSDSDTINDEMENESNNGTNDVTTNDYSPYNITEETINMYKNVAKGMLNGIKIYDDRIYSVVKMKKDSALKAEKISIFMSGVNEVLGKFGIKSYNTEKNASENINMWAGSNTISSLPVGLVLPAGIVVGGVATASALIQKFMNWKTKGKNLLGDFSVQSQNALENVFNQNSWRCNYAKQYLMEHYMMKISPETKSQIIDDSYFKVLHNVTLDEDKKGIRNIIEASAFAAEQFKFSKTENLNNISNNAVTGLWINGMLASLIALDLDTNKAKEIADAIVTYQFDNFSIKPDVSINPIDLMN